MAFFTRCSLMFLTCTIPLLEPVHVSSYEIPQEVVLVVREKHVLAFSSISSLWVLQDLMARERIEQSHTGSHVAVVITNRRVLGFSAETSQWDRESFEPDEKVISVEAQGKVASVVTNIRALGFGARRGTWVVFRFPLK